MSFIAAVQRPSFVVLGADSAVSGPVLSRQATLCKMAVHPTLPIALCLAGVSDCYVDDEPGMVRAISYVGAILNQVASCHSLAQVTHDLRGACDSNLLRSIKLGAAGYDYCAYLGVVNHEGDAEMGGIRWSRDGVEHLAPVNPPDGYRYAAPPATLAILNAMTIEERKFRDVDKAADLAARLKELMFASCDAESADGACLVGPPVYIAIVDRDGARMQTHVSR